MKILLALIVLYFCYLFLKDETTTTVTRYHKDCVPDCPKGGKCSATTVASSSVYHYSSETEDFFNCAHIQQQIKEFSKIKIKE